MDAVIVTCPWCGAPMPERAVKEAASQPFVTCAYCSATSEVTGGRAAKVQPGTTSPLRLFSEESLSRELAAAFQAAREGGASPHDALVAAANAKLGLMHGEAFARVCLALALELDAAHGTDSVNDGRCMARLINAYLLAIEGIRTSGSYRVNMPFFTVTPAGLPVHMDRTLTADDIAELARRAPSTAIEPPRTGVPSDAATGAASPTPPAKKKRFWPFG